jgi:hypothetical protein
MAEVVVLTICLVTCPRHRSLVGSLLCTFALLELLLGLYTDTASAAGSPALQLVMTLGNVNRGWAVLVLRNVCTGLAICEGRCLGDLARDAVLGTNSF